MSRKLKISKIQIVRIGVQIIFFILLPGLYVSVLAGIHSVYQAVRSGSFHIAQDLPAIIGALSVLPVTIIMGRFFCGWMCAFGAMGDWVYALSKRIFHINFKINENLDRTLKYMKYIILLLLFIVVWRSEWEFFNRANPWNSFGVLATVTQVPDIGYAVKNFALGTFLLLLIIAGSMVIERFFCRYLCPLGAVFSIVSKCGLIKIHKPRNDCGACKLCSKKCSMGIKLYQADQVTSGECIQCLNCVVVCPRNNARAAVTGNEVNPVMAGAIAVVAMTGVYYTGTIVSESNGTGAGYSVGNLAEQEDSGKYKDGTYSGSGQGFRGATTKVSVTVDNGAITDVEVVSYGDDAPYFKRAYSYVVSEIISSQSAEVDAVSGATYSSNGIMSAVTNALSQAE